MKIVCISDTHLMHLEHDMNIPDGDILIHAGDATFIGKLHEVAQFNEWFSALPHKYKIFVAGNHDFLFERNQSVALQLLDSSIIYLQDKMVEIEGLKIYGAPWQPRFYDWAFNLDRGASMLGKWQQIPDGIDILVTHGPPYGIGDKTPRGELVGCEDLLREITTRIKPRVHVFGHIHEGYGRYDVDGIIYLNSSLLDGVYIPKNAPHILELERA
jgi:Icc-related predicted phosphoesterase